MLQVSLNKNKIDWLSHNRYDMKNNNYCHSETVSMKNQFKRTSSLSVFAGTTGRLSTGNQPHELPCVSVCVCLSVSLTDCVILRESAGVDSRHVRGVCFMCIHIYFRGMNGEE